MRYARALLENIRLILNGCGLELDDIVKVTVFLKDMKDFQRFNETYRRYFKSDYPARSTVQAVPAGDAAIEVDAVALDRKAS